MCNFDHTAFWTHVTCPDVGSHVSDDIPCRVTGGTASEGGVLSVQTESGVLSAIFRRRLKCAVDAESVEERHQEQETHDTEDEDDEDGVNVYVCVLRDERRSGRQGHAVNWGHWWGHVSTFEDWSHRAEV